MARVVSAWLSPGRIRTWIRAASGLGNRYPTLDLGTPGLVLSNTTDDTNPVSARLGGRLMP